MSIEVKGVNYTYEKGNPGEFTALFDVDFNAEDGEIVAVVGHTGSGKSTLLQQLNGLAKPDSGTIVIDGQDITEKGVSMVDVRRKVGLVFQYPEYQLFEETVALDVAYGPKNLKLEEAEVTERVKEALTLVGLDYEEIKDRSPFELSGGQKRRVAIAGVLAMRPKVLILDEPTAGLDPKTHQDIIEMIRNVHERTGNITIFVSHNMSDVAKLADKVVVLDSGIVVACGTPREVFSDEQTIREAGLGLPTMTKITAELKKHGLNIKNTALTVDEAAEEILKAIGRND